jgi:hypothetical protein
MADLLAALARSANVRLALRETGISACWAYRRRKADPDFDTRWRSAVRAGRVALAKASAARRRDSRARRPGAGARLTVAGSLAKNTLRLEREKPCSFTEARRTRFIDALRATCNVRAAAAASDVSTTGAYRHYHADAAFRAAWDAALAEGRLHLEMALIGAARALFEVPDGQTHPVVAPEAITGMDARTALQVLRLHDRHDRSGRRRAKWTKPADPERTRAEILAKVAAVRAGRGR